MDNNPGIIPDYYFFCIIVCFFAQIFTDITPSTITVDSVNHTYTGTLSSSTYSGYKLAANTNKIVSSGSHTLTGYTGNNITLAITGNTVNVTNSKTSTTRTTELQNFIKSNWIQIYDDMTTCVWVSDIDDIKFEGVIIKSPITRPIILGDSVRLGGIYYNLYKTTRKYYLDGGYIGFRLISRFNALDGEKGVILLFRNHDILQQ